MKTSALFASFTLSLAAIARNQVPLQDQIPLEFAERILRNPNEAPRIPPGNFMSMLDSNKLCENVSTVVLSVPSVGTLTFDDGKAYMRNNSDSLNLPVTWTIAALKDDSEKFVIYHTDPFGKEYYLYDNGGHLDIITYSSSAGQYKVLYTNTLKRPSLVLSASDRCMTVYRGDDKVYLTDNSPCTPIAFKKVGADIAGDEDGDLGEIKPIKWYDPASSDKNPTCSGTLTRYMDKYKSGELNSLMAMSRDELTAQGWPENMGNFAAGLPYSIPAAAACGIACAVGSVHCNPCTGPGGIV